MSAPDAILTAQAISKRFGGVAALDDVSLEIRPGEVHCLAGANGSGKSTLIKVISGVLAPDRGTISVSGQTFSRLTRRHAIALGVEVIFQDFSLFPNLTVAENIALTTYVARGRRILRPSAVRATAREAVSRIGVRLDLDARVEDLSVADRQLTAICRALARQAHIIFMDEPTTALTRHEVEALFAVVETLRSRQVAIVFVSHKIEEVLLISRRITVLRNGVTTLKGDVKDLDRAAIIQAMVGRAVSEMTPSASVQAGAAPMLEVEHLSLKGSFDDVSFTLRPGEVVGVTGLLGSGRTEIAETLFGITPANGGTVRIDGKEVRIRSVEDAMRAGIGYVPGDRLTQGVFLDQSISRNLIAGSIQRLVGRFDLVRRGDAAALVRTAITDLDIRAPSAESPVRSLSGGNQQRVVLAKWLVRKPRVLILNSPTVGVDVGSKHDILEILGARAADGIGVLVISDDVPELVAACHRVLVVRRGSIVEELSGDRLTEQTILNSLAA